MIISEGRFQVEVTPNGVTITDLNARTLDGRRPASVLIFGFLEGGSKEEPELLVWSETSLGGESLISDSDIREGNLAKIRLQLETKEYGAEKIRLANK